jgi:hypothetical protein
MNKEKKEITKTTILLYPIVLPILIIYWLGCLCIMLTAYLNSQIDNIKYE